MMTMVVMIVMMRTMMMIRTAMMMIRKNIYTYIFILYNSRILLSIHVNTQMIATVHLTQVCKKRGGLIPVCSWPHIRSSAPHWVWNSSMVR